MKIEDTICHLITKAISDLETSANNGLPYDASWLYGALHEMRERANRMETGLKRRREAMINAGIESDYQEWKASLYKDPLNQPHAVNKIAGLNTRYKDDEVPTMYEVVVTDNDGEVVYRAKSAAGIACIVERVEDIDRESGLIQGQTQRFMWGHDLITWFAYVQLNDAINLRMQQIRSEVIRKLRNTPDALDIFKHMLRKLNNRLNPKERLI